MVIVERKTSGSVLQAPLHSSCCGVLVDYFGSIAEWRYTSLLLANNRIDLFLISQFKPVDEVFLEESLDKKRDYIQQYKADILVMGDDWQGKFDDLNDLCDVVYLPRTPSISTTSVIEVVTQHYQPKR